MAGEKSQKEDHKSTSLSNALAIQLFAIDERYEMRFVALTTRVSAAF